MSEMASELELEANDLCNVSMKVGRTNTNICLEGKKQLFSTSLVENDIEIHKNGSKFPSDSGGRFRNFRQW